MAQQYINIEKLPNCLRLTLNEEGKAKVREALDDGVNVDSDNFFNELLEYNLANGWEFIRPEDIGALTSAPILSDDTERDSHGKVKKLGTVYWHERYQIESPVAEMMDDYVDFIKTTD